MLRVALTISLLLSGALAVSQTYPAGGMNAPDSATGGGYPGRYARWRGNAAAAEMGQLAQQAGPRYPNQPQPQPPYQQPVPQGYENPQYAPQPAQAQGESPRARTAATPTAGRRGTRRTPRSEEDTTATPQETGVKKPTAEGGEQEKSAKKAEKTAPKRNATEDETDKSTDEATRAAEEATSAVGNLLKSANDGKYSEAVKLLTPESQKYFDSELSVIHGSLKTVLDQLTHKGDLRSVKYDAVVLGEGAVVDAELKYGLGPVEKKSFDLLKTKSQWRILLPLAGSVQAASAQSEAATAAPSQAMPTPASVATPAAAPRAARPAVTVSATPAVSSGASESQTTGAAAMGTAKK